MSVETIVCIEHLTRRFGETAAVNDLTLEVARGEVFGLLGHNGAGKTTTIRLVNGVLSPTSGMIRVLGMSPSENGAKIRQRTGVLTETPSLYEAFTARENLTIFANLYDVSRAEVARRVQEMLAVFELADHADEKVGGYSKGMKQRLALARALLHQPDVLFRDEPTAGLDPVAARAVHDLISHLSRDKGRTVFLCTHNLTEAQRLCDRVAVMAQGKLIALGAPADLSRQFVQTTHCEIEVAAGQGKQALAALDATNLAAVRNVEQAHPMSPRHSGDAGREILTLTGVPHEVIPDVLATLVSAGVRVYRVEPYEPTLEDVYFALQGQERMS